MSGSFPTKIIFYLLLLCFGCLSGDSSLRADELNYCTKSDIQTECVLLPANLAAWKSSQDFTIIDLRQAENFQRLRIPSSINYPAFALKTKSYLKLRKVLLVSDSYAQSEVNSACQKLLDHGFQNVKYLKGGVLAWHKYIGPLEGDRGLLSKLRNLSVNKFFNELNIRPWLLIDVSSDAKPIRKLPQVKFSILPFSADGTKFIQTLEAQINKSRIAEPNLAVALLGNTEKELTDLEALLRDFSVDDVFFIEGGKSALERYIQVNFKIINHLQDRLRGSRCE